LWKYLHQKDGMVKTTPAAVLHNNNKIKDETVKTTPAAVLHNNNKINLTGIMVA
jgi:hypothetical protein